MSTTAFRRDGGSGKLVRGMVAATVAEARRRTMPTDDRGGGGARGPSVRRALLGIVFEYTQQEGRKRNGVEASASIHTILNTEAEASTPK